MKLGNHRRKKCVYAISFYSHCFTFQGKKAVTIYPENIKKNENIQAIQEEWTCTKPDASCSATYCFLVMGHAQVVGRIM